MKVLIALASIAASGSLWAESVAVGSLAVPQPCTVGTLTSYENLGATGCIIDDKVFFNFSNGTLTGNLSTDTMTITPITGDPNNPGFNLNPNMIVANATGTGDVVEDLPFHYSVRTLNGASLIEDVSLGFVGGKTGTGLTSIGETVCVGGTFSVPNGGTSCNGVQQVGLNVSNPPDVPLDMKFITVVSLVDVFKDITVHSGTNGSASISSVTQRFSEVPVPEPFSILLLGTCMLAVAPILKKRLG